MGLTERFTEREVGRIVGLELGRLHYWQRLRLVRPQARLGARFYTFRDLVALKTLKSLTDHRIPARRVSRAMSTLAHQLGGAPVSLASLRFVADRRRLAVFHPGAGGAPFEPLTGQFMLHFERQEPVAKVHELASRSPEEWFEYALECESRPGLLAEAAGAYQRAVELAPHWAEGWINLGVVLYQLGDLEGARGAFVRAATLDPESSIAQFNLGCALEELGELDKAIEHLRRAVAFAPDHADAQFNLAAAYEKCGDGLRASSHWLEYLRCRPNGPWSDYARSRLEISRPDRPRVAPISFPTKR